MHTVSLRFDILLFSSGLRMPGFPIFVRVGPLNRDCPSTSDVNITGMGGSRDYFVYAASQWGTTLHCNVVSHWLGAYTKLSLPEGAYSKTTTSTTKHESCLLFLGCIIFANHWSIHWSILLLLTIKVHPGQLSRPYWVMPTAPLNAERTFLKELSICCAVKASPLYLGMWRGHLTQCTSYNHSYNSKYGW